MVNNFLKPGLQDLCVSRTSFTWGIPVSFDPRHVVYVWLDALSNYITGLGYDADGNSDPLLPSIGPADVHVIGKDIIRFHTIYWPIFLMALGLPLPKQVFGHPWLLMDGNKMSKSRGNVIYADELVQVFGVDAVRYFVLSEMPFDNDGNITWELINDCVNADLANTYGNLVSRTAAMARQYFGGELFDRGAAEPVDAELKGMAAALYGKVADKMDAFKISDALGEIFSFLRRCNKYIDETAPWQLAKDPEKRDRLATVLYNLAEGVVIALFAAAADLPGCRGKGAAHLLLAAGARMPTSASSACSLPAPRSRTAATSSAARIIRMSRRSMRPCIPIMQKKSPPRPMPRRKRRAIPRPHIPRRSPSTILPKCACRWGRSSPASASKRAKSCSKTRSRSGRRRARGQRHRQVLYARGDGRQKGDRRHQPEARQAVRHRQRGDDPLCGRRRGQPQPAFPRKEMESGSGIY